MNRRRFVIKTKKNNCWICESGNVFLKKKSDIKRNLKPDDFDITDSRYGVTGSIYRCGDCGFMQCSDLNDVIKFYKKSKDSAYDELRVQRGIQQRKLLQYFSSFKKDGSLFDIGAGSGILVEQALKMGFDAEGIEPSTHLWEKAIKRKLPIILGEFPYENNKNTYDIISMVDIIEHVSNPLEVLNSAREILKEDGIGFIVTPDVNSIMSKIMQGKWWHYRIAHIGYFQFKTLSLALEKTGFSIIKCIRPSWYFSADYIFERLGRYTPGKRKFNAPAFFKKITIPLNLLDSIMVIFRKK